jgi:hypothetical protein
LESALGGLIDRIADRLAQSLGSRLGSGARGGGRGAARTGGRRGSRAGRKLDMRCRVAGCKNMSRGPRFGFICDDHRKSLSKKDQQAAREAYKAKARKSAA